MFLATSGVEVSKNQFRRYSKLGGVKIGQWDSLLRPESILLRMHVENGSKEFGVSLIAYVPSLNTKVISYDILFVDELEGMTLIYEFSDYKQAKLALREISKSFDVPFTNKIAEKMARNKIKRRR